MNQRTIRSVLSHANKGHAVLLGYCSDGNVKVKVRYGPLGLITKRFQTDHDTFAEIKRQLRTRH